MLHAFHSLLLALENHVLLFTRFALFITNERGESKEVRAQHIPFLGLTVHPEKFARGCVAPVSLLRPRTYFIRFLCE